MISPGAEAALAALNEILEVDGGRLVVELATPTSLGLKLDLSQSSCPECVVPRDLMVDILRANLATADPDIQSVQVDDPRETGALPRRLTEPALTTRTGGRIEPDRARSDPQFGQVR